MEKETKTGKGERNGALDLIRIAACCGILYLHYRSYLCPGGVYWGDMLLSPENSGIDLRCFVEVFFVISGFLMFPYIERIRKKAGVLDFMRPRLWRMLPLLALGAVLYQFLSWRLFVSGADVNYTQSSLWGLLSSALGVQEGWSFINTRINPESWYVNILLLCYLIFYILVRLGEKTRTDCCWGFVFMILLGAACVSQEWELPFLGYMAGRGYQAFFTGLLLAVYLKRKPSGRGRYIVSGLILAVYLLYHIFAPELLVFGKFYLVSFFVAPALIVIAEAEPVRKAFGRKAISSFAKITFACYVLHTCTLLGIRYLAILLGLKMDYPHEVMLLTYMMTALAVGALAYFTVERPFARIGKGNSTKKIEK
ncbi:MAG: acyltransferase [Lachnospiraceae bacterium]|nr:acyltransferase [Lachnospiraceae bacterium]